MSGANTHRQDRTARRDLTIGRIAGAILLAVLLQVVALAAPGKYPGIVNGIVSTVDTWMRTLFTALPTTIVSAFNWPIMHFPVLAGLALGALLGKKLTTPVRWLRIHGGFAPDSEVLVPLPQPRAYDPLWGAGLGPALDRDIKLPWISPRGGTLREDIWKELRTFATEGTSDGANASWKRPEALDFIAFRWAVLVGRTGSGKTRMAVEFLRRELGQTERLEGVHAPGLWSRRLQAVSEWFRRFMPGLRRRLDDPWDIGWVQPSFMEKMPAVHENRRDIQKDYTSKLESWRPRRPTALLLDDPKPGDSRKIVDILRDQGASYHFPVRLLVVNQTAPADLFDFKMNQEPDARVDDGKFLCFNGKVDFETEDMQQLIEDLAEAFQFRGQLAVVRNPELVSRLLALTEGNPMLVELAVHCLLRSVPLDDLTAGLLIDERVNRIVASLETVNRFGAIDYAILASMTLAGPSVSGRSELWKQFEAREQFLRGYYNLAHKLNIGREALPSVRPERVGDAFVRWVFKSYERQREVCAGIVPMAWSQNPSGVLRTVARAGAQGDALGKALREPPPGLPDDVTLDAVEAAMAFATAAVQTPFGQEWPQEAGLTRALSIACERLRNLPPETCGVLLDRIARDLVETDTALVRVRFFPAGYCCYCSVLSGYLSGTHPFVNASDLQRVIQQLDRLADHLLYASGRRNLLEPEIANKALRQLADLKSQGDAGNHLEHLDNARLWALVGRFASLDLDVPGFEDAISRLDSICEACNDEECAFLRAKAYTYMWRIAHCERAANTVEAITATFPGERFALIWAKTQRSRCRALCDIPSRLADCEQAVRTVGKIAAPYSSNEEFALVVAESQASLCCALDGPGRLPECERAAKAVEKLARLHRGVGFTLAHADAQCYIAHALSDVSGRLAGCERAVKNVEKIAANVPGEHTALCLIRAQSYLCFAYAALPEHLADCERTAEKVEAIGSSFSGQQFALARARALRSICFALRRLPRRLRDCEVAAEKVEAIAAPFAGKEFALERALAQHYLCFALASFPNRLADCEQAAKNVESIAENFTDEEFPLIRARTQAQLCVAYSQIPSRLPDCKRTARSLQEFCGLWPQDESFQELAQSVQEML